MGFTILQKDLAYISFVNDPYGFIKFVVQVGTDRRHTRTVFFCHNFLKYQLLIRIVIRFKIF